MRNTVGRNELCPCGSGLKYKHCCGKTALSASILYVHPAKQGVEGLAAPSQAPGAPGRPYALIPLGVPALVNRLQEDGFEVAGVSLPLETFADRGFDLRTWLQQYPRARLVMIDLHWYEHAYGAIAAVQAVKAALPAAKTVLGGLTASGFSAEILADFEAVDYIIRGDAEQPLTQLARYIVRGEGELADIPNLSYRDGEALRENALTYSAASADLDQLVYSDLSFLAHGDTYLAHEYIVVDLEATRKAMQAGHPFLGRWIATARGCKFECSYCGGCKSAHKTLAGRDGIVPRSPEAVVADLQRLVDQGAHQASLSYDIAEMGEDYWRQLFALIRKRGLKIGLYNEFFQLPDPAFIKHFARTVDMTHSCLALSPLSGSERVRHLNGKRYRDAELVNILDHLNLYSIPIFVYFSLNLPGEDEVTILETVGLAERIHAQYPSSLLKILSSCHTMDPFSPMQQHPEKYGVTTAWSTFKDYYTYCKETLNMTPDARTGMLRGFESADPAGRSIAAMADIWDTAREGREASWWPIPPSW
jgi:radical SAM superfamily enzyme YgiQ (UPF0313 family)